MHAYRTSREPGWQSKKRLGQHFLVDRVAVLRIVDAANLTEHDTVLEIGPGPGTLTTHLAQRAGQVIAVEVDERMLVALRESLKGYGNVHIVHADILEQDIAGLTRGRPFKVVANLPYYITSAVLRHLLQSPARPSVMVVTVQREVAERIVGRPERRRGRRHRHVRRMSLLAVSVQFYGVPRIVTRIPAGAFRPMPAVDSAVVRIDVYDPLPWGAVDEEAFFRVARAGFAQSRKQLRNALVHNLPLSLDQVLAAFNERDMDATRRAETLAIEEWVALSDALGAQLERADNQKRELGAGRQRSAGAC